MTNFYSQLNDVIGGSNFTQKFVFNTERKNALVEVMTSKILMMSFCTYLNPIFDKMASTKLKIGALSIVRSSSNV